MLPTHTRSTPAFPQPPWTIQSLGADDIDAVLAIQSQCYGHDILEPRAVYERRLRACGHCCLGAARNGRLQAYLAAYWSRPGAVTPLHGDFAHHADASVLYLHDMAVAPEAKGQGAARALLAAARNLARQRLIRRTALVSVQASQAYWQGLGYAVEPVTDTLQQQHLRTYGAEAVYMAGEF